MARPVVTSTSRTVLSVEPAASLAPSGLKPSANHEVLEGDRVCPGACRPPGPRARPDGPDLGRAHGQHPSIGAEGQAQDDRARAERRAQAGPGFDVPEVDGAAVVAGGQDLAVGPEGQDRRPVDMRQQRRDRPGRAGIPDLARVARAAAFTEPAFTACGRDATGRRG